MFDFGIGTSELMLIVVVALIVVGPKELPGLLRTIGQWVSKVRALASEFQTHLDDLANEAGVNDVKKKMEEEFSELSIEDLDRDFAELESELREQLAEGAREPKPAETLDLDEADLGEDDDVEEPDEPDESETAPRTEKTGVIDLDDSAPPPAAEADAPAGAETAEPQRGEKSASPARLAANE